MVRCYRRGIRWRYSVPRSAPIERMPPTTVAHVTFRSPDRTRLLHHDPSARPPAEASPQSGGAPTPPPTVNTGAIGVMGLQLQEGRVIPRRQVLSWALWDWATQPFNSVILTFVFTALYLTSDTFLDPAVAALGEGDPAYERALSELASALGWAITIAGILIAVLAPVLGQRADVAGRRKLWLGGATAALVLCMVALFFVQGAPAYFVLGISLIAAGTVFSEIAGVNYNAMLVQVSTPKTVGKVSGLGWGLGYVGGIVALVLVVVATTFDWWGMPTDNGLAFRVIALGCAVWTLLFAWPVLVYVPEAPPAPRRERVSFWRSYVVLVQDIAALWRGSRPTFWFLLASAVFRDGLAGRVRVRRGDRGRGVPLQLERGPDLRHRREPARGRLDDRRGPLRRSLRRRGRSSSRRSAA